jgi:hypothetical protein
MANPYAQYKKNPYAVFSTPGAGPKPPTGYADPSQAKPVVAIPGGPNDPAQAARIAAAEAAARAAASNPYEMQQIQAREAAQAALQDRNNQLPVSPGQKFDNVSGLRKELEGRNAVQVYKNALPSYASALRSPDTPAGDQDMIYAFAKIMDPNSVVREGEANSVAQLGTLGQQIVGNLRKQLSSEGKFTPELRVQLRNTLAQRIGEYDRAYNSERGFYRDIAKRNGLNPDDIIGPHLGDAYATVENQYFRGDPNKSAAAVRAETAAKAAGGGQSSGGTPSGPLPGATLATGDTHAASMDPKTAGLVSSMIQNGYNADQINKILVPAGVIGGIKQEDVDKARVSLSHGGQIAPQFEAPNSTWNKLWSSPVGVGIGAAADSTIGGLSDEASGLIDYAQGKGNLTDLIAGHNAGKQAGFAADPRAALTGQVLGNVGGMIGTGQILKGLGIASKLGRASNYVGATGFGALEGAGQNNDNRVYGAGTGAVLAGAGYPLGEVAAAPINAALRTRPGMAFSAFARNASSKLPVIGSQIDNSAVQFAPKLTPAEGLAANIVNKAGPDAIKGQLAEAGRLGVPMSIADTTPEAWSPTAAAVRRSPTAAKLAEDTLIPRGRGQIDRFTGAVNRDLGPVGNVPQASIDLMSQAKTAAAPLYDQFYGGPAIGSPELDSLLSTPFGRQALNRARTIAANERRNPMELGFSLDKNGDVALNPVQTDLYGAQAKAQAAFTDAQQAYKDSLRTTGADKEAAAAKLMQARADREAADSALASSPGAGTAATGPQYGPQTLDYVKRGMDDVLEQQRNPITGKLVLDEAGRAQNEVRAKFLNELDKLNPNYGQARKAYAGPAQARDALARGQDALSLDPNELGIQVGGQSPEQLAQMQLGFRSGLVDQANKYRMSTNPFDATLGTPAAEQRLGTMFGNNPGVANILRQRDLEAQLARTSSKIIGGSDTAARQIANQQFVGPNVDAIMDVGSTLATGGVPVLPAAKLGYSGLKNIVKMGAEKRAVQKADEFAPMMLNTDPAATSASIDELLAKLSARRALEERQNVTRPLGMFGAGLGSSIPNSYSPF